MKPDPDVSGVPYNVDTLPMWIYPNLWDETKRIRLRVLWFVLLYIASFQVFISLFMFIGAIVFSRSIGPMLWYSLMLGIPVGGVIGLASWWDFSRRSKKILHEGALKKSETQSQNEQSGTSEQ